MKILRNVSLLNPSELHLSRTPSGIYFIWPLSSLRLMLQSLVHHTLPAGFLDYFSSTSTSISLRSHCAALTRPRSTNKLPRFTPGQLNFLVFMLLTATCNWKNLILTLFTLYSPEAMSTELHDALPVSSAPHLFIGFF